MTNNKHKNTRKDINGKIKKKEFFTSFLLINEKENENENDAFFLYSFFPPELRCCSHLNTIQFSRVENNSI